MAPALYGPKGRVPLKPFAGDDRPRAGRAGPAFGGAAARASAAISTSATSREGTTLYLPVEVEGALFSIGDTHAAQGDGEVCGTAIESQMDVELTLDLVKGANLKSPRFTTAGPGHAAISTAPATRRPPASAPT